uniref:Choline transporter-like protein n=1 Tax=Esox lucius TaxID=8010 RepID=A0A6Q2YUA7_ESOLU
MKEEMGNKKEESSVAESEYGEPAQYDPTFNGPIRKRGCTDIICCVLFMLVILGYMVVGILAWLYGDPRQVLYPRNSAGMYCGIDQPSVFYYNILKCAASLNVIAATLNGLQCPTTQVCVQQCPNTFWGLSVTDYLPGVKPANVFNQSLCLPTINLENTNLVCSLPSKLSFLNVFSLFGYFIINASILWLSCCVLKIFGLLKCLLSVPCSDITNGFNARDIGVKIFEDFASSWQWVIAALVIAMVVSFLFLLLLRFIAPVIVWVLILGVLAVGAYGKSLLPLLSTTNVCFTTNFGVYLQVKETWLAFLIIISVVEAILLLTLIFLRTRIFIAIALIQESSKAISHMMSTLFYPIITFILLLVCVAYWGITALYLATSGTQVYNVVALNSTQGTCGQIMGNVTCDPQTFNSSDYPGCPSARCVFIMYNTQGLWQRNMFNLQIYNVVAFLWCINFVLALGQCTLAGAFASYYWAFSKPSDIPTFPLSQAFIRTLRYHVGSLAFGALILTLVQLVRIILEYLDHKTRAAQNPCARFLFCCLKCCFWCLEKFIKFLNRNAYIMIAVYGKNFCVSAKNAFLLLMRNIVRVVVLDKITDLLLFFGKLLVVGGVGVLAFFFFSGRIILPGSSFRPQMLHYYWMPIIVVIVGAYLIAHGFFSVYNMCVDTLFLCFLEDLERHDGSVQKPYYMSKNLMKILNKKNQGPKKGKDKN